MSNRQMNPFARLENARALAAALGVPEVGEAQPLLAIRVALTFDTTDTIAEFLATQTESLLRRTIEEVGTELDGATPLLEIVYGAAEPRFSGARLFVNVRDSFAVIATEPASRGRCQPVHAILLLITSCYVCAAAIKRVFGARLLIPLPTTFVFPFAALGLDLAALGRPFSVGESHLAGAGAIGNGLLWALQYLPVYGRLHVVDFDNVSAGNLNRQLWFEEGDIGAPKAARLCQRAQPHVPTLSLTPHNCALQDLGDAVDPRWLKRLIVAVDSRRARRTLQYELPGEVFDASTTDFREVVIHHHRQPAVRACLSCIYVEDAGEVAMDHHIAAHLGVSVDDMRTLRVSASVAVSIAQRFPEQFARPGDIVGQPYDSLYKVLCGGGHLGTLPGDNQPALATFGFVSALAGAYLALELVRRLGSGSNGTNGSNATNFNYWKVSPWHPPLARGRRLIPRNPECAFCSRTALSDAAMRLWRTEACSETGSA